MKRIKGIKAMLQVVYAVFIREMTIWLRYPSWILTFIALPYLFSGLFYGIGVAMGGQDAISNFKEKIGVENVFLYYVIGTSIFLASNILLSDVSGTIRSEQLRGTFELQYLSPANKVLLWGSVVIPHGIISSLVLVSTTLPIIIISASKISIFNIITAVFFLLIGLIPLFGIAFTLAALTVKYKEPWAIANILNSLFSAFSGFTYPIWILPKWLQIISYLIPLTHVNTITRALLLFNQGLFSYKIEIILLAFYSIIYPLFGISLFKRWEIDAKKKGELSKY